MLSFPYVECGFKPALADVAPGADEVENNIYAQRLAHVISLYASRSLAFIVSRVDGAGDLRSHSGFNVVRHHLATLKEYENFFGSAVESGVHQRSIEWIVEGRVDASAIDSTVLELELAGNPGLSELVVSVGTLGPSPMPPWIARRGLATDLQEDLKAFLIGVHEDEIGSRVLRTFNCARFVAVDDAHYDPIRSMAAEADLVRL